MRNSSFLCFPFEALPTFPHQWIVLQVVFTNNWKRVVWFLVMIVLHSSGTIDKRFMFSWRGRFESPRRLKMWHSYEWSASEVVTYYLLLLIYFIEHYVLRAYTATTIQYSIKLLSLPESLTGRVSTDALPVTALTDVLAYLRTICNHLHYDVVTTQFKWHILWSVIMSNKVSPLMGLWQ